MSNEEIMNIAKSKMLSPKDLYNEYKQYVKYESAKHQ